MAGDVSANIGGRNPSLMAECGNQDLVQIALSNNGQTKREGARKGRSDRETVPAILRERSLAGVLGIALTTMGAHSDAPPILHAAHVAQ
jgi:hypothetical protein